MLNDTCGNADAAIEFLEKWRSGGPWVLTAICPETRRIETTTFRAETRENCRAWIAERDGSKNLYFMTNPAVRELSKKAAREDVAELAWIHVDVDPRTGEDLAQERERIRLLVTERLPRGVPPPTCVIDSGGGYQAFWRLAEPLPIDGDVEKAEQAKLYNLALETALGADATHDVSRIMRLPGTINLPDARKRKKGRTKALATLVEFNDNVYPLSTFTPSAPIQTTPDPAVAVDPGNVPRLGSVDELSRWNVPDRVKVIIVQGRTPNEPKEGDDSRSAWLFDAVCSLVRCDVPDDVIYSVITDPDFGISESVLAASNTEKYALRQIEQAREAVAADEGDPVAWVNQRYFAALEGGKIAYFREEADGSLEAMQAAAFGFELATKEHEVQTDSGAKLVPYSVLWKKSPRRRYYPGGFVLDASEGHGPDTYNLWKGFGVEPAPGGWPLMREHIETVLAEGNAAHADYILQWTAWTVQNPATPPRVALVFKGDEGVGKGVFCNALVQGFGVHGMRVQNMLHLAGRFNAHLRHLCLLFADEALVPGSDHEGTLKGLITEPTTPIERKGYDVVNAENHLHVVMASNNEWVVPAGIGARRFAIFAVPDHHKGDRAYFSALFGETRRGGLGAMLHDLLAMDLGSWHPEAARPDTMELAQQKTRNLGSIERVWFDSLVTGLLPPCAKLYDQHGFIPTAGFRDQVQQETRDTSVTMNRVSNLFEAMGFAKDREKCGAGRGWKIPPLGEARRRWDDLRFRFAWDETDQWADAEPDPGGGVF